MSLLPPLLVYSEEPRPTPVAATGFPSTDAAQSQLNTTPPPVPTGMMTNHWLIKRR